MGCHKSFGQKKNDNGWQFHAFFGSYTATQTSGPCPALMDTVAIGFKHTREFPSIEIRSPFSTSDYYFEYLRNLSMYGGDCYECDSGGWETNVVGGNGANNAFFKKTGVTAYTNQSYLTVIEIVKAKNGRTYMKWNSCSAELIKN